MAADVSRRDGTATVRALSSPDDGLPAPGVFDAGRPYGMALDSAGDLFVANNGGSGTNANTVIEFGSSITTISSGVRQPTSIAVSSLVTGIASVSESDLLAFGQATLTLTQP
jgi:sugar lactone lactonase YvrE